MQTATVIEELAAKWAKNIATAHYLSGEYEAELGADMPEGLLPAELRSEFEFHVCEEALNGTYSFDIVLKVTYGTDNDRYGGVSIVEVARGGLSPALSQFIAGYFEKHHLETLEDIAHETGGYVQ
jgi:hypothetical protein